MKKYIKYPLYVVTGAVALFLGCIVVYIIYKAFTTGLVGFIIGKEGM